MNAIDRNYALATHAVMKIMEGPDATLDDAVYKAATDNGLGLNQYGRLMIEAKKYFSEKTS